MFLARNIYICAIHVTITKVYDSPTHVNFYWSVLIKSRTFYGCAWVLHNLLFVRDLSQYIVFCPKCHFSARLLGLLSNRKYCQTDSMPSCK